MNAFQSYSQHGEDYVINNYFKGHKSGVMIDVGAFDGLHISNSYALYKAGWKTISIEANPQYYSFLVKNRPDSINVNLAMVKDEAQKEVVFQAEQTGLFSGIKPNTSYFTQEVSNEIRLPASTLNEVVTSYLKNEHIDCISIDVEGTEEEVLAGLDLKKHQPSLLIIEANDKAAQIRLMDYLKPYGYRLSAKIAVNVFFLYKPGMVDVLKLNSVRINCTPVQTMHPVIPSSTQNPFKQEKTSMYIKRVIKAVLHFIHKEYIY